MKVVWLQCTVRKVKKKQNCKSLVVMHDLQRRGKEGVREFM